MLDLLELCTGSSFPVPNSLDLNIPEHHQQHARALLPSSARYIGFCTWVRRSPKSAGHSRDTLKSQKLIETEGGTPVFFIWTHKKKNEDTNHHRPSVQQPCLPLQIGDGPTQTWLRPFAKYCTRTKTKCLQYQTILALHICWAVAGGNHLLHFMALRFMKKFPPMIENIHVIRAGDYGSRGNVFDTPSRLWPTPSKVFWRNLTAHKPHQHHQSWNCSKA